jgi:TATA-box binding protein (TBP) (component of TFIID and TFIIIB)
LRSGNDKLVITARRRIDDIEQPFEIIHMRLADFGLFE